MRSAVHGLLSHLKAPSIGESMPLHEFFNHIHKETILNKHKHTHKQDWILIPVESNQQSNVNHSMPMRGFTAALNTRLCRSYLQRVSIVFSIFLFLKHDDEDSSDTKNQALALVNLDPEEEPAEDEWEDDKDDAEADGDEEEQADDGQEEFQPEARMIIPEMRRFLTFQYASKQQNNGNSWSKRHWPHLYCGGFWKDMKICGARKAIPTRFAQSGTSFANKQLHVVRTFRNWLMTVIAMMMIMTMTRPFEFEECSNRRIPWY